MTNDLVEMLIVVLWPFVIYVMIIIIVSIFLLSFFSLIWTFFDRRKGK